MQYLPDATLAASRDEPRPSIPAMPMNALKAIARKLAGLSSPGVLMGLWLVYSLAMLGYLAHLDAQRGIFCMSL
ncbi:MAG: hypothetical protein ACOCPR_06560 [Guyparkeria sp.]